MATVQVKYEVLEDLAHQLLNPEMIEGRAMIDYLKRLREGGFTGFAGEFFCEVLSHTSHLMIEIGRIEDEASRCVQKTIEEMQQADQTLINQLPY